MPTMLTPSWIDDGSTIPDPFGYGERAVQWLRKLKHPKNPAPDHPFTLDPWQERIIRAIYGPDHEHTLLTANSVALDLRLQGEFQSARELDEDNLARRRRVLGEDTSTMRSGPTASRSRSCEIA
jgi:hypothetical protein